MSSNDTTLTPSDPASGPGLRVAIVIGIAVLAGISVWLVTGCNRDDTDAAMPGVSAAYARIVPVSEIDSIPEDIGHDVFWAGERPDTEVELSDDPSGNVHLRYLTDGTEAGSAEQTFLDIGTYPFAGAYETTKDLASQKSLARVPVGDGIGFYDKKRPYSVIISFPDHPDLQIEVYHPEKNAALDVVRSGDIVPVP